MWKSTPCWCGVSTVRFMGLGWAAALFKALWHMQAYPHLFPPLPEFRQLLFMQHVGWDLSTVAANKALNPGGSVYPPHPTTEKHSFFNYWKYAQLLVSGCVAWSGQPLCIKRGPRQQSPTPPLQKVPDTWEYPDKREVPFQQERGLSSHRKCLGCERDNCFSKSMFWWVFSLAARASLLSPPEMPFWTHGTLPGIFSTCLDQEYLEAQGENCG